MHVNGSFNVVCILDEITLGHLLSCHQLFRFSFTD